MKRVVENVWRKDEATGLLRAAILDRETSPEGLDVARVRLAAGQALALDAALGHVVSPLRGAVTLTLAAGERAGATLALSHGRHAFLPPGSQATIRSEGEAEILHVAGAARGARPIVRDERFVYACALGEGEGGGGRGQALRWILTPQYLSRRIFLHHDEALVSRAGHPLSYFRTTMFDTAGLPPNEDGESVFKMAYHSRTELNVCYDVTGDSAVRYALHPYRDRGQAWEPWQALHGEATYLLPETREPPRNKHEVRATPGGHTTLFCVFDPAPTGVERHQPGEYSDYEPIERVTARPEYEAARRAHAGFDAMMDTLSWTAASGSPTDAAAEALHTRGRETMARLEAELVAGLDPARAEVVRAWTGGR